MLRWRRFSPPTWNKPHSFSGGDVSKLVDLVCVTLSMWLALSLVPKCLEDRDCALSATVPAGFGTVGLNAGWLCHPGNGWQCLETVLVATPGEEGVLLAAGGGTPGMLSTSYVAQDKPLPPRPTRNFPPQCVNSVEIEKAWLSITLGAVCMLVNAHLILPRWPVRQL